MIVVCEQESAQIWINGEYTGLRTPSAVVVPLKKSFSLELKAYGFQTYKRTLFCEHEKSFHYGDLERTPLRLVSVNEESWGLPNKIQEFVL